MVCKACCVKDELLFFLLVRSGTRIEGKYKNNILVASVSGGKASAKLFILRSGKMKDRVDAATSAAHRAADVARQKAEIANARYVLTTRSLHHTNGLKPLIGWIVMAYHIHIIFTAVSIFQSNYIKRQRYVT